MDNQPSFLPFHAINEFMRPDFRLSVIRDVINNLDSLPRAYTSEITHLIKHTVNIPGFRNSEKAPNVMKVMPTTKVFEKNPEMVSAILTAWAHIHGQLFDQVYAMLKARGWEIMEDKQDISIGTLSADLVSKWPILPSDVDRSRIPGFVPRWPKGEDFEELYKTYTEQYPNENNSKDQVSLMAVWITLRLPYAIEDQDSKIG